jgi:PST family polysaccharide transporter
MNLIASITTPLTVTMAVLSDEIIAIVLGPQWLGASVIFKILAVAALGQPVASATGWIYQSLGQTRRMMIWAIISTPPLIVAFAVGLPWGAVGVATAYAITDHLRRIPLFLFAFKHSPITMKNLIDATWRPFLLSLIMWLVMSQVRSILPPSTPAWTIFYCCAAGALTMAIAIVSWPRARQEASSVIGFVRFLWPQRRSEDLAKTRSSRLETATSSNNE